HRLLALFRARREEILFLELDPGSDAEAGHQYAEGAKAPSTATISNMPNLWRRFLRTGCWRCSARAAK
ncbi:hypothetical protein C7E17_27395, partial [Stenotrophomonas maltophilia]